MRNHGIRTMFQAYVRACRDVNFDLHGHTFVEIETPPESGDKEREQRQDATESKAPDIYYLRFEFTADGFLTHMVRVCFLVIFL